MTNQKSPIVVTTRGIADGGLVDPAAYQIEELCGGKQGKKSSR